MPTEDGLEREEPFLRDVAFTGQFKKDFKREKRGKHRATVAAAVQAVVEDLANDVSPAEHMRDHPLSGNWKDHRDCHVRPDLVLIYKKVDPPRAKLPATAERPKLYLVRLGSHSELGI